ncbi:TPA: insulinase family protein, partial [Streptococcus equi subsp. zooepidemicus]|nr:insulinase family protein [Streptococcus equi subsp. zooepidemicus]
MKKRINTTVDWTYIPCDMTDIYVGVTVNRGSLHDGHKKGIAHFLEHMLLCISDKD